MSRARWWSSMISRRPKMMTLLKYRDQPSSAVSACSMTQKLANLYNTIDDEVKNRDSIIDNLKEQLRAHGVEVVDVKPEELKKEPKNE